MAMTEDTGGQRNNTCKTLQLYLVFADLMAQLVMTLPHTLRVVGCGSHSAELSFL